MRSRVARALSCVLVRVAVAAILCGQGLLSADSLVYSNITSPGFGSFPVSGGASAPVAWEAAQFTPSADYEFTAANVRVGVVTYFDTSFDVFLYSDLGGLPDVPLEQIGSQLHAVESRFIGGTLVVANTINTPLTLVANTAYWLVLRPGLPESLVAWIGDGSPSGLQALSRDKGANWSLAGSGVAQFQIFGTPVTVVPVPEPASILLLAGVLGLLKALRRVARLTGFSAQPQ